MDLFKLLAVFVIFCPLPNKTKLKFDQEIEARWLAKSAQLS